MTTAWSGSERVGALEQEDVGLLAGLEDAELGVDRTLRGDHPVRAGLGTAAERLDVEPGRPALIVGEVVVRDEVEDELGVERVRVKRCRRQPAWRETPGTWWLLRVERKVWSADRPRTVMDMSRLLSTRTGVASQVVGTIVAGPPAPAQRIYRHHRRGLGCARAASTPDRPLLAVALVGALASGSAGRAGRAPRRCPTRTTRRTATSATTCCTTTSTTTTGSATGTSSGVTTIRLVPVGGPDDVQSRPAADVDSVQGRRRRRRLREAGRPRARDHAGRAARRGRAGRRDGPLPGLPRAGSTGRASPTGSPTTTRSSP